MDVTSLLNSNPNAAEQQKRADGTISRAPSRNRTPWDAGGYSLPINTASHGVKITQPHQPEDRPEIRHNDLRINTPPSSPKHKFSDSRSSLSSVASSLQSTAAHSRYSSTSTLNSSFHAHHKSHGTDILSPELRSISQAMDESASLPLAMDHNQASEPRQDLSVSLTGPSLEQLALVAERHASETRSDASRRSLSEGEEIKGINLIAESGVESTAPSRVGSPSDAILIKRTSIPSLRVNTRDLGGQLHPTSSINSTVDRHRPSLLQNRTHKRTWSEPYFKSSTSSSVVYDPALIQPNTISASSYHGYLNSPFTYRRNMDKSPSGMDAGTPPPAKLSVNPASLANVPDTRSTSAPSTINHHISVGPQAEPTPPSSHHPDDISPTSPSTNTQTVSILASGNNTQNVTLAPAETKQAIVCMYVANCDTGSQLRKAISHIFGRNKMCTRQIPDDVWVFYCRKHYQRVRYRNPKMYAQLQCNLVQEQLKRIHLWSEENLRNNRPSGVVLDWTLAVRKREQKRVEERKRAALSKKRKRQDFHAEDDEETEENDNVGEDNGHEPPTPLTAVPEWLRVKCQGDKYTIVEILEIFNRLHREILNETGLTNFPDLEILPNISVDHDAPKSPKGYSKRTSGTVRATGTGGHQRSVSMTSVPSSQHSLWGEDSLMRDPFTNGSPHPNNKKSRPSAGNNAGYPDRLLPPQYMSRPEMYRPVDHRRRSIRHMPSHLEEYPEERAEFEEYPTYGASPNNGYYSHTRGGYQVQLAAPTPQRSMRNSTASQLEGHEYNRLQHGRSRSDVGFMNSESGFMQHMPSYQGRNPYTMAYGSAPSREQDYPPPIAPPHTSIARAPPPNISDPHVQHPHMPAMGNTFPRTHHRHQSTPSYGSPAPTVRQSQSLAPPPPSRRDTLQPPPRATEREQAQQLFPDRH